MPTEGSFSSRQGGGVRFAFLGPWRAPGPLALSLGTEQRKPMLPLQNACGCCVSRLIFPVEAKPLPKMFPMGFHRHVLQKLGTCWHPVPSKVLAVALALSWPCGYNVC